MFGSSYHFLEHACLESWNFSAIAFLFDSALYNHFIAARVYGYSIWAWKFLILAKIGSVCIIHMIRDTLGHGQIRHNIELYRSLNAFCPWIHYSQPHKI